MEATNESQVVKYEYVHQFSLSLYKFNTVLWTSLQFYLIFLKHFSFVIISTAFRLGSTQSNSVIYILFLSFTLSKYFTNKYYVYIHTTKAQYAPKIYWLILQVNFIETSDCLPKISVNTQLIGAIHNIYKIQSSNFSHHQKKP